MEKRIKFIELYRAVQDNIWRYCLFMAQDRESAKDLLGDTIAAAYASFDSLRNETTFLSFLFTIASRIFFKEKFKKRPENIELDALENMIASDMQPDDLADISFLHDNLNRLPIEQKETLILFYIEGFSRSEIAAIQHISEETVKTRLARGKSKLAKLMGVDDE